MSGLSIETKCLHLEKAGNSENSDDSICGDCPCQNPVSQENNHYGSISFPIYQSATYAHPAVGQSTGFDYSRAQNPTRAQLEKVVCALEGGIDAFALSSGMAAIALVMELFSPGDNIIAESDLYGGTIRLFDNVSAKNGVTFTRLNYSSNSLENLITEKTKAIYIETPTNPMMNVTDIAKIAEITKKHNLL